MTSDSIDLRTEAAAILATDTSSTESTPPSPAAEAGSDDRSAIGRIDADGQPICARAWLRAKSPYLLIGLAVLVLDQWSKWMVEANVAFHDVVTVVPGFLNIIHVRNTGVAFGFLASHGDTRGTLMLLGLGLAALTFVAYYFWIVPLEDRFLLLALGLVMGGAVGNLVDRMANGGVTDFIDAYYGTYHWHTFNVADSAISVGIGLMILSAFLQPVPPQPEPLAASEARGSEQDGGSRA